MAINGIETVLYAVDDVAQCTRYFEDFGLPILEKSETHAHFRLDEGSNVIIRHKDDPLVPQSSVNGIGVHQVIWGVDSQDGLDRAVRKLSRVTDVTIGKDGTAYFKDCDGIAMGLRVFRKNPVHSAPDPVNSPGNINRINQHRKWKTKARPKTIQHVVFVVPGFQPSFEWYRDNLDFRATDFQGNFGIFARAEGANDHHNIYWLNANLPFPGFDGKVRFNHVNYGVEDLDEVMVGANHMERQGWPKSIWGLGRHRIASSVFMYLPCPAGGDAEYGADSDHLDDSWVPRVWEPRFGTASFITNIPEFLKTAPAWDVHFHEAATPPGNPHK